MTTNNTYLKTIAEKVTETEISGTHTDNYYLKLICTTYGYTYTGTVCDGKLIKDFASAVTSKTYNRIHFDNKYYHDIAESLTGNTYDNKYDNFYLGIIAENITPPTPLKKLDHLGVELIAGSQILSYADEQQTSGSQYATVRFTAYADAGETETIPNLSLDFKVGSGAVTSVVTDSNGRYEYTYHSQGVGDVEIVASKTVEGILVSKTYDIQDMIKYDDATSDKSSNYTATNTVLTFDTDHYVAVSSTTNQASNYMAFVEPKDMPTLSDFIIECDIKFVSGTGQSGLNYIDAITTASASQKAIELISAFNNNQKGVILRPWDASHRVSGSLSTNTWYTFKLQIQGTTVTGTITKNGSNVYSQSFSWSTVTELAHMCIYQADVASTIHWKNLKIKPL